MKTHFFRITHVFLHELAHALLPGNEGHTDKWYSTVSCLVAVAKGLYPSKCETYTVGKFCSLNPFPNKPWFLRVCSTSLLKTLREKEKLFVISNFSFSHSVFYPFGELFAIFIKLGIVLCKLFQFGRV